MNFFMEVAKMRAARRIRCLLYTSDAADDLIGVELGGRRILKKKKEGREGGRCRGQKAEED